MKYCSKCGNELMPETKICMNCGCPVTDELQEMVTEKMTKKKSGKKTLFIIIAAIAVAALVVGGFFLVNYFRQVNVINDLSGNEFLYFDSVSFPSMDYYRSTTKVLKFDNDGKLTYSCEYFYSSSDDVDYELELEYKIKFKNGMIILETYLGDEYEIQYDKHNRITGIYDIELDQLYD